MKNLILVKSRIEYIVSIVFFVVNVVLLSMGEMYEGRTILLSVVSFLFLVMGRMDECKYEDMEREEEGGML